LSCAEDGTCRRLPQPRSKSRIVRLVDAVSFITMRQRNIGEAFAFDPHFEQEGFSLVS